MYDFSYQKPASVDDAVKLLAGDPEAKALAGGMTYIPVLKMRLAKPTVIVDLAIDFDGTLSWNKTAVDRKTMQGYISQEASKDPQPEVHITVDKFAKYEKVAQTLADLQSRGLKKIGFVNNDLF